MTAELLGVAAPLLALFAGFGVLIGLLFGFFGMGGSFLVTPALMAMGYDTDVAVASGLAFVFATSVIATLKHRDLGQVDYKLGVLMIAGTTAGIEVGKMGLHALQAVGLADTVVSVGYVGLLGGIGAFVTYHAISDDEASGDAARSDGHGAHTDGGTDVDGDADGDTAHADAHGPAHTDAHSGAHADAHGPASGGAIADVARKIQSFHAPPMIQLRGDVVVSLWMILGVGFATGVLSGLLGVGGGFIRMPALFYLIGVPVPVAVGTDLFEIVFSGGIGSFLYAMDGAVDLAIVVPLLAGSALGARLGAGATSLVEEGEIEIYFGAMLLLGAVAVAIRKLGTGLDVPVLETVSLAIILGAATLVAGAVVVSSVRALRTEASPAASAAD